MINGESKKKTCKRCYAADTGTHPLQGEARDCVLGYKTDGSGHPLELCPKPKSWKELDRIQKKKEVLESTTHHLKVMGL